MPYGSGVSGPLSSAGALAFGPGNVSLVGDTAAAAVRAFALRTTDATSHADVELGILGESQPRIRACLLAHACRDAIRMARHKLGDIRQRDPKGTVRRPSAGGASSRLHGRSWRSRVCAHSAKACTRAGSRRYSNRPERPPCPPSMVMRSRIGAVPVVSARNFATHLAGSQ